MRLGGCHDKVTLVLVVLVATFVGGPFGTENRKWNLKHGKLNVNVIECLSLLEPVVLKLLVAAELCPSVFMAVTLAT